MLTTYVVTFDQRPVVGIGALSGLRRMTLIDARSLIALAGRIPKRGRIIDVETLAVVETL
jgi:hypothetical protein